MGCQQLPEKICERLLYLICKTWADDHEYGFQCASREIQNEPLTVKHALENRRLINSVAPESLSAFDTP